MSLFTCLCLTSLHIYLKPALCIAAALLCLARCLSWGWGVVDAAGGAGAGSGGGAGGAAGDPAELLRSLQGGGGLASLLGGAGGLGTGAGAGAQGGMAEMTAQLLEDPNMRDQMINMMTQPGMIDMIASSNPQLGQMINSMPMIRQTMQNPEMLRAMLNPDMMRMMAQFSPGMVSTADALSGGQRLGFQSASSKPSREPARTHSSKLFVACSADGSQCW